MVRVAHTVGRGALHMRYCERTSGLGRPCVPLLRVSLCATCVVDTTEVNWISHFHVTFELILDTL